MNNPAVFFKKDEIKNKIKKVPWEVWLFLAIFLAGVFFRTYEFRDWLRFGPDQSRDSTLIEKVIAGREALPLLGPQAGSTSFYLGPIYYYFAYISLFLFGSSPEAFAYPIAFFSILSIPLFYLLMKRFFSLQTALFLTAVYSFSYFMIFDARFSSNPNLTPFFLLLFILAILKLTDDSQKETRKKGKLFWYAMFGIAIGVGIQIHTLLFLSFPALAFLTLVYLIWKRSLDWRGFLLVFLFIIIVDWGQVLYNIQGSGSNIKSFFKGASGESSVGSNMTRNLKLVTACQLQANAQIIFPLEEREDCSLLSVRDNLKDNKKLFGKIAGRAIYFWELLAVAVFSLGGYVLLFYYLFKRNSASDFRRFLGIVLIYNLISFVAFVPVASEIGTRYFIMLFIIPFVLLGLWLKKLRELKLGAGNFKKIIFIFLAAVFLAGNAYAIGAQAARYNLKKASDSRNSVLDEISPVADFMVSNAASSKMIYLGGERAMLSRFSGALGYLVGKSNVVMEKMRENKPVPEDAVVFYIADSNSPKIKKMRKKSQGGVQKIGDREIIRSQKFGKIELFLLKNEPVE